MRLRERPPGPQARALRVAFGEEDGPSIEPFLVAVATLSMLTAAAEESTVLCVVEDAHWLDSATADALLFCARRLGADRVLLVFSARDGAATPFRPDGIDELHADRARPGRGARAPRPAPGRRAGAGGHRTAHRRERREPAGAAGAARPSSAPDQLGGSSPLPAQLHLTTRVEQAFLDRSRLLPPPVQSLLLLAAADDTGDLAVVRRAASTLGVDEQALEAAVASGLLVADGRVGAGASPARALGGLPGRHRRATTRRCTGRWPTRWPVSETPTARRGTAPPPPRGPTPRSSRRSSASGPAPSVAEATSPRWPPTNARQR